MSSNKKEGREQEPDRDSGIIFPSGKGKVSGYQPIDELDTSNPPSNEGSNNHDPKELGLNSVGT